MGNKSAAEVLEKAKIAELESKIEAVTVGTKV